MVEKTSQSSRRTSESSLPDSRVITMKSNSLKKKLREQADKLGWKERTTRVWYDPENPENAINLDSRYLSNLSDIPTREKYFKMSSEEKYKHGGVDLRAQRKKSRRRKSRRRSRRRKTRRKTRRKRRKRGGSSLAERKKKHEKRLRHIKECHTGKKTRMGIPMSLSTEEQNLCHYEIENGIIPPQD